MRAPDGDKHSSMEDGTMSGRFSISTPIERETREVALLLLRAEVAAGVALLVATANAATIAACTAEVRRLRAAIAADRARATASAAAMRRLAATRRTGR